MKDGAGLLTLNALAKPRFLTLGEVEKREPNFREWKLRNDMVAKVVIMKYRGFLCAGLDFVSGEQGVLYGHRSEANLGVILLWLAALFETPLDRQDEVHDLLDAFRETPIRVLHREDWGESMSDNTYIGHFMKDKFLKVSDLVMAGIVKEEPALNAATLREALLKIRERCVIYNNSLAEEIDAICGNALAAPPRNCDRPEIKTLADAIAAASKEIRKPQELHDAAYSPGLFVAAWLLAEATAKEGEKA